MIISTKWHIFRLATAITGVNSGIASLAIILLYPREDWLWELSLTNFLVVVLTMSVVWYIGTKLATITRLQQDLKELVERDRLTDVATRDFFFASLAEDKHVYGVSLMIDIDHFKSVNDTYGHLAGDKVIRSVAQVLKSEVREQDIVCRFGGEEFIVFLHDATEEVGWQIAERIRTTVEGCLEDAKTGPVRVTVSVGGSLKDRLETLENAIKRADECLYRAKQMGRNRTVVDWDVQNSVSMAG